MKKVILITSTLVLLLVAVFATQQYNNQSAKDQLSNIELLSGANIIAFETAVATEQENCFTCYSVVETCWLFGCTNVTTCGGTCPWQSVDKWKTPGTCGNCNPS